MGCSVHAYLIQVHQEGDIGAQVGGQFAILGVQCEALWRSVWTLLLPGRVHLLYSFGAVVQNHFTVPVESCTSY